MDDSSRKALEIIKGLGGVVIISVVIGIFYLFLGSFKKVIVAILIQILLYPFLLILMAGIAMNNDSEAMPTLILILISIVGTFSIFAIPILITSFLFGSGSSQSTNTSLKQVGGQLLKAIRRA